MDFWDKKLIKWVFFCLLLKSWHSYMCIWTWHCSFSSWWPNSNFFLLVTNILFILRSAQVKQVIVPKVRERKETWIDNVVSLMLWWIVSWLKEIGWFKIYTSKWRGFTYFCKVCYIILFHNHQHSLKTTYSRFWKLQSKFLIAISIKHKACSMMQVNLLYWLLCFEIDDFGLDKEIKLIFSLH